MVNGTHIILPYGVLPKDVVDLETVLGPFFLAQCFNWALYGVLCLQVYIYYLRFPRDLAWIKVLVYSVFTLDTFFIVCVTHAAWRVLVSYWGDVNIFHNLDWTWAVLPMSSGLVSMIVQLFFVWRIYKLSHSFTMPFIISMITMAQCAFAIRTTVIAYNVKNFHYIRDLLPAFWLGGSMLADILISATIVRILWNSKTGFKDTDSVVARLMRLSIEAAAVPTITAAIKLGLIYSGHDNKHLVFCVVLARLYSNTMLGMLNGRDQLFGGGSKPDTMAGASRLSDPDRGSGIFHSIKTKLAFVAGVTGRRSSPSSSHTHLDSRLSKSDLESAGAYGDQIFIQKSITSTQYHDVNPENPRYSVSLHHCDVSPHNARRGSDYTLDSMDQMTGEDIVKELPMEADPFRAPDAPRLTPPAPAKHRPESNMTLVNMAPVTPTKVGFGVFESRSEGVDRKITPVQEHRSEHSVSGSDIYPGR